VLEKQGEDQLNRMCC